MNPNSRDRRRLIALVVLVASASALGCQDENSSFIQSAPPAPKSDHPNETYTERRSRTYRPSRVDSQSKASRSSPARP